MAEETKRTYIGPEAIIEKKKKYIMPCLGHFYKEPREFVRGSMQYLYDSEGRKYLDCFAGVSVMNCGHCNPEITKKVQEQVGTLQHVCNIYLTENFVNLAEKLAQVTPARRARRPRKARCCSPPSTRAAARSSRCATACTAARSSA